ncbi:hypothetical protein [Sulfurirhabdus autotrophica]|uniref:Uncharacterized protein n=1 Tax=Sulfurirhabdus autotrophica TaxID=1706046 RepID=A0A4R3XY96_9PROT|nr:hypothetical protein [Sulfurirhabdus autotrophica]TCV84296.1 hypothetical protein EDC63_11261 [Sulfurirhabdus autotrophica]
MAMFLLDYIKQRWAPKGPVVNAGVPPEARPDQVPVTRELIALHLAGSPHLPQDAEALNTLFEALSDPFFIQTGARDLARKLIQQGKIVADLEKLVQLLNVLTNEITRRMYIDSARQKEGAIGIRLFSESPTPIDAIRQLVEQDSHGLGKGIYPFDSVPENPTPGQRCGFYVRVATADSPAK